MLRRIWGVTCVALILVAFFLGVVMQSQAANDKDKKDMPKMRSMTIKERQDAAKRAAPALAEKRLQLASGIGALALDPNDPYYLKDLYFGIYPNWAYSPLPTGPVTGITLTSGGSRYTAPSVNIVDAYGTDSSATASATVVGGGLSLLSYLVLQAPAIPPLLSLSQMPQVQARRLLQR